MEQRIVLAPKVGKNSATLLATALGIQLENPYETKRNDYLAYDIVIKYGVSLPIHVKPGATVINKSGSIKKTLDKVKCFQLFPNEDWIVPWTLNKEVALKWIKEGNQVYARATSTGANSEGITPCVSKKDIENSPALFWTKYLDHTNEFRVYCWKNRVVAIYDKVEVDLGEAGLRFSFRLYNGVETHPQLVSLVNKFYEETNLDWYGLDLLRDKKGKLFFLEANTAPVLYPTTLNRLTTIIREEVFSK